MPGGPIPMGGGQSATQGASMYIPYADALSSYKQEYQAANRPFTIGGYGAPQASTWDQFQKEWGQTYNQGGRIGYAQGTKRPGEGQYSPTKGKDWLQTMPKIDPYLRRLIEEYKKRKGLAKLLEV